MKSVMLKRVMVWMTATSLSLGPVAMCDDAAPDPTAEGAVPDAAQMVRVEAAVDRALQYLAQKQDADGWWPQSVNNGGPNNGINALCVLAYLGRGHTPNRGPYKATVSRAIRFILSTQDAKGLYASRGPSHGPMYEHALSTLAMIEAYGSVPSLEMRKSVQRAVDLIVSAQNGEGGWRYNAQPADADLSASVMQVVALHAAQNARLNVPQATLDKAQKYVRSCIAPGTGFSYQPGNGPSCAQSAAGALCMQLLGQFNDKSVTDALATLKSKPFNGNIDPYFYYTCYYAMQAHFQAGDAQWSAWHPRVRKFLLDTQNESGSWPAYGSEANISGSTLTYSTAMAAMCLEVYMHYLPAYQR